MSAPASSPPGQASEAPVDHADILDLKERLNHYERQVIPEALRRHDFQINDTAGELGISR